MTEQLAQEEDKNSLFTNAERAAHQSTERALMLEAKQSIYGNLFTFWQDKRALFILRAIERNPYAS